MVCVLLSAGVRLRHPLWPCLGISHHGCTVEVTMIVLSVGELQRAHFHAAAVVGGPGVPRAAGQGRQVPQFLGADVLRGCLLRVVLLDHRPPHGQAFQPPAGRDIWAGPTTRERLPFPVWAGEELQAGWKAFKEEVKQKVSGEPVNIPLTQQLLFPFSCILRECEVVLVSNGRDVSPLEMCPGWRFSVTLAYLWSFWRLHSWEFSFNGVQFCTIFLYSTYFWLL